MDDRQLRDLSDRGDTWWTIDQAAAHFGMTRKAVQRYIREGLTVYAGEFLRRDEFLAEWRRRRQRQFATRGKKSPA